MAASTTIDVDLQDIDSKDGGMDTLDFHSGSDSDGKTHQFTNFPHSAADSDDEEEDFDRAKLLKEEKAPSTSFWTFAYYQQFFDVETRQVGERILGSMTPIPGRNYLNKYIRPNPDLYGPFWICTTLVFTTAIAGNLANYFSSAGKNHWTYDFHKVTLAATAIFSYWWLIPLILFSVLWWRRSQANFTFLELICVYGYSLAIYVPISILWAIQVGWLQWTLVIVGAVLSGSVLLMTFWPAVSEDSKQIAFGLMAFIFIMHASLAVGFVLYFFYVPSNIPSSPVHNTTVTPLPPLADLQQPPAGNATGGKLILNPGQTGPKGEFEQPPVKKSPDSLNTDSFKSAGAPIAQNAVNQGFQQNPQFPNQPSQLKQGEKLQNGNPQPPNQGSQPFQDNVQQGALNPKFPNLAPQSSAQDQFSQQSQLRQSNQRRVRSKKAQSENNKRKARNIATK